MNERTTTPRRPVFDYVAPVDPALSTLGWKIVGLAHAAMILPLLGAFLPRDEPVRWGWILVVGIIVVTIGGINLVSFRKMVRARGYRSPPVGLLLTEVLLATVAAGVTAYAILGTTAVYRPLIFVPTLLVAMVANRAVIAITWATATASVALSALATGVVRSEVAALVVSYGTVWGVTAVMVHQLAVWALHSDDQVGGLAELAGIAARSNSLSDGLAEVLPVTAALAEATRAGAFRVVADDTGVGGPYRFEPLGGWSSEQRRLRPGPPVDPPAVTDIDEARVRNGVVLRGGRATLLAEGTEGDVVAVVVEGIPDRPFDHLMTRFNLERIAAQVDVLVNRARYVARLEALGRTDGLTGLANRRSLFEHLERACDVARRRAEPLAVVMTDLDHFKTYNDSFGHLAGDDLLRRFATHLRERTRSVDVVARYGGEEFVLVLPDTGIAGARTLLGELQRRFRTDETLGGVTCSAGVAVWDGAEGVEALVDRADRALYRAKAAGRDRSVIDLAERQRDGDDDAVIV